MDATEIDALRRASTRELKRSWRAMVLIAASPVCLVLGEWVHGPGPEPSWPWFLIITPLFIGGLFLPIAGILSLRDVHASWRVLRRDVDAASVERFVAWESASDPKATIAGQLSSVERLPFSGRVFSMNGEQSIGSETVPVFEAADRPDQVVEWGVSRQMFLQLPAQVHETATVARRKLTAPELAELAPHITRVLYGGCFLVVLSGAMVAGIAVAVNVSSYRGFNEWAERYAPLLYVVLTANVVLWAIFLGKVRQARKLRKDADGGWVIVFTDRDSGVQAEILPESRLWWSAGGAPMVWRLVKVRNAERVAAADALKDARG